MKQNLVKKFILAQENHKKNNLDLAKKLYKEILKIDPKNFETNFMMGSLAGQINDFKRAIKAGVDDDLTNWVKDALQKQSDMTKTLQELLSTPEVNREVVREAMSGNQKFKDPLPAATHILKFDEAGKSDYVKIDDRYVDYVASQTSFNISLYVSRLPY